MMNEETSSTENEKKKINSNSNRNEEEEEEVEGLKNKLEELKKFSTCQVADVLVKLGIKNGGLIPDINLINPKPFINSKDFKSFEDGSDEIFNLNRISGRAFTVQMVYSNDYKKSNLIKNDGSHYIDSIEKDSVIVISTPRNCKSAVWGGLMTARAKFKGSRAVIIDGRYRDLEDHYKLDFPVFARGKSVLGQSTFTRPYKVQEPIEINPILNDSTSSKINKNSSDDEEEIEKDQILLKPITINPNDIILADQDGVISFGVDLIDSVIEKCKIHDEIEKNCLDSILNGFSVTETFKKFRSSNNNKK